MTDTFRLLGPEVFSGIAEVELRLAKASARLDSLIESVAPTDTEVKRQVQLWLQRASEPIHRALNELEAAESSAGGAVRPDDSEG